MSRPARNAAMTGLLERKPVDDVHCQNCRGG
jgi:hypothetical protein